MNPNVKVSGSESGGVSESVQALTDTLIQR
jgi:hypothetical protein